MRFKISSGFCLIIILIISFSCTRKHTYGADQHLKEEQRKSNSDNFLLSQAHTIINKSSEDKSNRVRKKEKRKQKMLDFLHHINKKDDPKQAKAIVPPFKP